MTQFEKKEPDWYDGEYHDTNRSQLFLRKQNFSVRKQKQDKEKTMLGTRFAASSWGGTNAGVSTQVNYKSGWTLPMFQASNPKLPVPDTVYNNKQILNDSIFVMNLKGEFAKIGLFYPPPSPQENVDNPLNLRLLKEWRLNAGEVVSHTVHTPIIVTVHVNDEQSDISSGNVWVQTDVFETIMGLDIILKTPSRWMGPRYELETDTDNPKNPLAMYMANTVPDTTLQIDISTTAAPLSAGQIRTLKAGSQIPVPMMHLESFTLKFKEDAYYRHVEKFVLVDLTRFKGNKLSEQDTQVHGVTRGSYVVLLRSGSNGSTFEVLNTRGSGLIRQSNAYTGRFQ